MPSPIGDETTGSHVTGSVLMTHPVGLHARPSVKLTKLAKTFSAGIGLALAAGGPWIDAKSIVKVMATKAPGNSVLYFRASGTDAEEAVQALVALVEQDFGDGSDGAGMCEVRGRPAAPGVGLGPLVVLAGTPGVRPHSGDPDRESAALRAALAVAAAALGRIVRPGDDAQATAVLEFQVAMLQDEALVVPALSAIAGGAAADTAWLTAVDAQIRDYEMASEEYFRARSADLRDLRDRVCQILIGAEQPAPLPPGAILAGEDLMPSIFLEIDWRPGGALALTGGSASSHVAMLARARGVPMVVGLGPVDLGPHRQAIVDGDAGRLVLSPDAPTTRVYRERLGALRRRHDEDGALARTPAVTADGRRIAVMINVAALADLAGLDPECCDGIGLVRTELLFPAADGPPDEERQHRAYREILAWAAPRPVTIRTLDAGGDKPIAGLTLQGEANPFLGLRGIRLSLARPEVFRVQLRALARAALYGTLKIMLPMVTIPAELAAARQLLGDAVAELRAEGIAARRPPLGMMVEVPAAALTVGAFDADFLSIGTNDLIQYVTASARDLGAVASLGDPASPAVLRLIAEVAAEGRRRGIEVSLCGDMGGEPAHVPRILACGVEVLSVAPGSIGRTKVAIARCRATPR